MASDSLRQVGKSIRHGNRQADLALKRFTNRVPKKERTRDAVSSLFPFRMFIASDGKSNKISMNIKFQKPPPSECAAECIATACVDYNLSIGAHSLTLDNPYEPGTIRVFSNGAALPEAQWEEENPSAGQVYVQVQAGIELIVICYSYIIC